MKENPQTFSALQSLITNILGQNSAYTVSFYDEEGDNVLITNDKSLQEAYEVIKDQQLAILKLHISKASKAESPELLSAAEPYDEFIVYDQDELLSQAIEESLKEEGEENEASEIIDMEKVIEEAENCDEVVEDISEEEKEDSEAQNQ